MTFWEEALHHAAAVSEAAAALDAARAAHDPAAEAIAIARLEAADRARQRFAAKLDKATSGCLDDYDPARAPGRAFWDGKPR